MSLKPIQRSWDDYFIPGTSTLRNLFASPGNPYGEPDPSKLRMLEEHRANLRLLQLAETPIRGQFDYDHMKAIRRHIFQDVYEWAGEERTAPDGPMFKGSYAYYPAGAALTAAAEEQYRLIAEANRLRGMELEDFVTELAERWGELNVIHSFREGNTRSQFVFFSQLADEAGYSIDTRAFRMDSPLQEEFVQARFHSQSSGSNDRLAAVLAKVVSRKPGAPE